MLPQIRELIVSKLGLHFPDEKQGVLFHNLSLAAKELGFHDNNHLTEKLLTDKLNKKDIGILASYLTVSETFFLAGIHGFFSTYRFYSPRNTCLTKKWR